MNTDESKHSEMGPARQNPIQRTARTEPPNLPQETIHHSIVWCKEHNTLIMWSYNPDPLKVLQMDGRSRSKFHI